MLENSIFELRNTVKELEKRLSSVQDEGKWIATESCNQLGIVTN